MLIKGHIGCTFVLLPISPNKVQLILLFSDLSGNIPSVIVVCKAIIITFLERSTTFLFGFSDFTVPRFHRKIFSHSLTWTEIHHLEQKSWQVCQHLCADSPENIYQEKALPNDLCLASTNFEILSAYHLMVRFIIPCVNIFLYMCIYNLDNIVAALCSCITCLHLWVQLDSHNIMISYLKQIVIFKLF